MLLIFVQYSVILPCISSANAECRHTQCANVRAGWWSNLSLIVSIDGLIIQPSEHFLYLLDLSEYYIFPKDPPCLRLKWTQFILSNSTFIRSECEWWLSGKETTCSAGDTNLIPGSGRSSGGGRAWQPTPVFLPGESHGQRSLAGYSLWGCKELDMTEAT